MPDERASLTWFLLTLYFIFLPYIIHERVQQLSRNLIGQCPNYVASVPFSSETENSIDDSTWQSTWKCWNFLFVGSPQKNENRRGQIRLPSWGATLGGQDEKRPARLPRDDNQKWYNDFHWQEIFQLLVQPPVLTLTSGPILFGHRGVSCRYRRKWSHWFLLPFASYRFETVIRVSWWLMLCHEFLRMLSYDLLALPRYRLTLFLLFPNEWLSGSDDERHRPRTSPRERNSRTEGTRRESAEQITSDAKGASILGDTSKSIIYLLASFYSLVHMISFFIYIFVVLFDLGLWSQRR